jgi:hypothetical protein
MVEHERNRVLPRLGDRIRDALLLARKPRLPDHRDGHPDGPWVRLLMRERPPIVGCSSTEPPGVHAEERCLSQAGSESECWTFTSQANRQMIAQK